MAKNNVKKSKYIIKSKATGNHLSKPVTMKQILKLKLDYEKYELEEVKQDDVH